MIATTESPLDPLAHHAKIRASGWKGRVITAYRPDPVVDPEFEGFRANVEALAALTGENAATWRGYLAAHRNRRAFFKSMGATSTDHGHPTAADQRISPKPNASGCSTADSPERSPRRKRKLFRGQMLTEMACMSVDDGLVMQIHPGSFRNHNPQLFERYGRDKGADIPMPHRLRPGAEATARPRSATSRT